MLASHNTLTYLPARRWWAKLLRPYWQCQAKTASQQVADGARALDIRIRRTPRGYWRACHGIIDLGSCDYPSLLALLQGVGIAPAADVTLRVVLERTADPEADILHYRQAVALAQIHHYQIPEVAVKRPWAWLAREATTPATDHYYKPLDTARPWYAQLPSLLRALWTTPRRYARLNPIPPEHRSDPHTLHYHDFI